MRLMMTAMPDAQAAKKTHSKPVGALVASWLQRAPRRRTWATAVVAVQQPVSAPTLVVVVAVAVVVALPLLCLTAQMDLCGRWAPLHPF
jgi:hypothetical protein